MIVKDASIEESLPICNADEVSSALEPSDDDINYAYNIFDAEKMKYFNNIFVKTNRDFLRRKKSRPSEWNDFSEVVKLCRVNGFNLQCYIKYCFLNRLVTRSRGRSLSDISYLRNTPQIMDYARNKTEIEKLFSIYRSIQKSILLVRKMNREHGLETMQTIKKLLMSKKLSIFISTGTVSPYFVALIPKASIIIHAILDRRCEDGTTLIDFCNRIGIYSKEAIKSLSMFYPNAMTKTIVEMCS